MFNKNDSFPKNHVLITPSDANLLSREMLVFVVAAGDVKVSDDNGAVITYPAVPAYTFLPIVCSQVFSTGTTSSFIVGCYD